MNNSVYHKAISHPGDETQYTNDKTKDLIPHWIQRRVLIPARTLQYHNKKSKFSHFTSSFSTKAEKQS